MTSERMTVTGVAYAVENQLAMQVSDELGEHVPGGDAECSTGNGITGQKGRTGNCGPFGQFPVRHFASPPGTSIAFAGRNLTLKLFQF